MTPTPRSPSPRSRRASTCSARSRSPTPWPRPRRWRPRRPAAAGERRAIDGRLHLSARAGHRAGPPARRRRSARADLPRAGAVPAGLDRRSRGAVVVAAAEGQGRLRCARRHRGPHRRPDAVHHRRPHRLGVGRCSRRSSSERPLPAQHSGLSGTASDERGVVDVDDAAVFLARFAGGAVGTFEATRFANGRKNAIRIEINGSLGSLVVRLRGHEPPALLRRHARRPRSPGSAASW